MHLRKYLLEIATKYDRHAPMSSLAQQLLRNAHTHLTGCTPAGIEIIGSGGKGSSTFTPWIGFFDPDETVSPEHGLYVVYLFAQDLRSVTLMINHGITRLQKKLKAEFSGNKEQEIRRRLSLSAETLRNRLSDPHIHRWDLSVDLASSGRRQRAYGAGCVVARRYDLSALPSEEELRSDLWDIIGVYQRCILIRQDLDAIGADPLGVDPEASPIEQHFNALDDFKPKDSTEYLSQIQGRELVKQRRHESLIAEYVPLAQHAGFNASNNHHPRDLLMWRDDSQWLVEAKVVYNGNGAKATREAIAQLLDYRYFFHPEPKKPRLVGLFTESVGQGYIGFLNSMDVATVWKSPDGWQGCELATRDGLVPQL
ncbi:DUF3578 domain-containing protein [Streptomonospora sp. PA3]|uniref:MrcB family domain-containing protein n=1 Tax=Streptomonospora sp. PA3 TaxID=2607326 RepID=UPI0012DED7A1|nr:DUF3578 domain-containing protein [Streptomonospora sp. PA3]MUL41728.1 DUF3578 domain-containing protein [Streptomonospora sp. PA3]